MNKERKPFLIGIAGGTCCGKSELCKKICEELGQNVLKNGKQQVIILGHKSFYRHLSDEDKLLADTGKFNFDHPNAFDDELTLKCLHMLKQGKVATIPKYNFATHSREEEEETIYPADVILFEGILALYNKDIRDLLDMKIFVDTDSDTRLARRVLRDTVEHKRDIDSVLNQYTKFVKRSFEDFTLPTKRYADVIIPKGVDNLVAIELITQHIQDDLITSCGDKSTERKTRRVSESGRPH
ncbi:uridine-cytidine kinase 2-A-like [Hydractinia symbiolongicarpus]|uniref:uridine-cytidine kinase 2-A-like n=1 Tax=Hydractinia symbiolongicarpus TaxID=13093 RepID=UPI00254F0D55|nr:uridine-cytidine kinase 2-A-like [Hydractinia symbiolongicarpus]XP_057309012.1 uridine-cytidine kinase 2-A-like [Hydractinia symbiolongicarpus]XP_057309013.1 uridine-cytidine kinase 2-A-like [Hydractinia symbiolongicarpus]